MYKKERSFPSFLWDTSLRDQFLPSLFRGSGPPETRQCVLGVLPALHATLPKDAVSPAVWVLFWAPKSGTELGYVIFFKVLTTVS